MQASLYHFIPDARPLIDRMRDAARQTVIVSEPVRNLATSRRPLVARLAARSVSPGDRQHADRFTEASLDALMARYGDAVRDRRLIPGGRDKIYVLRGSAEADPERTADRVALQPPLPHGRGGRAGARGARGWVDRWQRALQRSLPAASGRDDRHSAGAAHPLVHGGAGDGCAARRTSGPATRSSCPPSPSSRPPTPSCCAVRRRCSWTSGPTRSPWTPRPSRTPSRRPRARSCRCTTRAGLRHGRRSRPSRERHELMVIEDAAQGVGATWRGARSARWARSAR